MRMKQKNVARLSYTGTEERRKRGTAEATGERWKNWSGQGRRLGIINLVLLETFNTSLAFQRFDATPATPATILGGEGL